MFENGVVPQVGQLEVAIEEGLTQKLSRRVTADMGSGCKLLDATLADMGSGCKLLDATLAEGAAMGLLSNQTYQLIAAHCIQKSAQAVQAAIKAIRRNIARNTTFHY